MTEYPRDQFDDVPEYRDRKGSHRALVEATGSGPSGLTWISLAAALALAVGAFSYFILPVLLPTDAAGPGVAGASASVSAGAAEGAQPSAGGPGEPDGDAGAPESAQPSGTGPSAAVEGPSPAGPISAPEESGEPEETQSAEPTKSPGSTATAEETAAPATVDYSFPVEVYNASNVGGLAGRVGGTLSGAGYTVATAGNWAGFPVSSSGVFYSSSEVTAEAVAAQLGLPAVYDERIPGIAVVLTADYAG